MPTFQKCPVAINEMANSILCQFDTHQPLLDAHVKIDFVFAYGDRDEQGVLVSNALSKNGCRALGIARKMPLKDRAMGRGDAEIALDHDHWETISEKEQRALLDHELHHLSVKIDKRGIVRDDLNRPVLQLRHHDYEFGWFNVVAERHKGASIERIQAAQILEDSGQFYWPALTKA
jgi:putative metallopeptidase